MHFPTDRTAHTTAIDTPIVNHWLERKITQIENASAMQDRSTTEEDLNLYIRVLYRLSYTPRRMVNDAAPPLPVDASVCLGE